jgi:hypothetical protein
MTTALEQVKAQLVAAFGYGGGAQPLIPNMGEIIDLISMSIQAGELAPLSVSTAELADGAVTAVKVTDGTLTAAKFAQGAALGAAIAAGLGASVNVDHADASPVTLIAADGAKDRAVLVMAIITETLAGGTTKPSFSLGWDVSHEGLHAAIVTGSAGVVLMGAGVLPATKAGICTVVNGTGTAIAGAIAVVLLALPTT